MRLWGYISDKRYFVLFYFLLMIFITFVVSLDSKRLISFENILYINIIAFLFFLFYLTAGYLYHKRYYNHLEDIASNIEDDIVHHLPEPLTYQDQLYNKLIRKIYYEQKSIIEKQGLEKRENKEFVASWFHEIKTPIAVSRLIMEDSADKTQKELIKDLAEEIDKIESQVEQALYYSKIDAFERDYFIQEINLDKLIKGLIKKHSREFITKKIELDLKELKLEVHTDKKWLSFIIDQILSNSLKYTEKNGKISIWTKENKNHSTLKIRDTGIGIKKEDLSRVFDKGFTGYIGRREEKSTGIGLYLAKKLAKRLGHEIFIESQYGEFTEIEIRFPKVSDYYNTVE